MTDERVDSMRTPSEAVSWTEDSLPDAFRLSVAGRACRETRYRVRYSSGNYEPRSFHSADSGLRQSLPASRPTSFSSTKTTPVGTDEML